MLHNINRTGGKIFEIKSRSYAVFRNLLGSQVLETRTDKKEQWRKTILFNHLIWGQLPSADENIVVSTLDSHFYG